MHSYSVALRISGTDLDVAEVSATLRLRPTQTRLTGQLRSAKSVWPESMWEYEVRPRKDKGGWDSLEDGLRKVISAFVSRKSALRKYQRRFKVFLWCGHFSSSFGGGPTLSPIMLKALGDLGVELILETYFADDPRPE
jgi:Domain of unknown function (DUF4279)